MEVDHLKTQYVAKVERHKQQMIMSIQSSDNSSEDKQNYIKEVKELIQGLEQKLEKERQATGKRMTAELQDEMAKLQSKQHQLT